MPSLHHIVCLSPLAGLRWVRGTDKEEIVKLPRDLYYDIIIRPPWPIQISLQHTEQLALLAHYNIPVPLTWVVSGWASCVKWHCQCVGLMVIPDFDTKPAAVGAHRKRSFGNAQCIDFLWLGEINYWKKIPWVLLLLVLLIQCEKGELLQLMGRIHNSRYGVSCHVWKILFRQANTDDSQPQKALHRTEGVDILLDY